MAEFHATKKYSGRAGVFGEYSKVEGSFSASSNDDKISRNITKDSSYCVDYAMKRAVERFAKEVEKGD
ncbi:MAG: hypothetical protein GOV02_04010 [Candidatus Aenigmarchaeota archaeon]|nr:hypothetical protein [Candidatus Aenigmarchaeota archaeon]